MPPRAARALTSSLSEDGLISRLAPHHHPASGRRLRAGFALLSETATSRGLLGIALVLIGAYALNPAQVKLTWPRSWFSPLTAAGLMVTGIAMIVL